MLYSTHLRLPSFWVLQFIGWCCFGLASLLFVMPYVRQPWELGYPSLETLLADQLVICFGFFLASLALRPVCRSLLRHPLPWFTLQFRAFGWSLLVGGTTALQPEARAPASRASHDGMPFGFAASDYATRFSVRTGSRVQIISANDV